MSDMSDGADGRVTRLRAAARAARELGIAEDAARVEAAADRIAARGGFSGAAFVMALVGGTGVGKSSLLNALAGHTVSAVRAVRPTTDEPLAWVAEGRRDEVAALLAWLGVRHQVGHADDELASVVVLDLPDLDSVRPEHRALVDRLLPKVDAITWVADPEKYDDARLHAYVRSYAAHADRMRFVVNKADRLGDGDRAVVATDVARRLVDDGIARPTVDVVAASTGAGIPELRASIAAAADAKAVVAARQDADAAAALADLAATVGVVPGHAAEPLVPAERRESATAACVNAAVALVDPAGTARQVQAAVMARARRSGGSLLGRTVAMLAWMTGQQQRSADPVRYLGAWRSRGSLAPLLNPVRATLVEAAAGLGPRARPAVLRGLGSDDDVTLAIGASLDAVTADAAHDIRIPRSALWPLIGALQLVVGAGFLLAIAWYVTLFVSGGQVPVGTVTIDPLGPLPIPLVLLAGTFVISAALGWVVRLHAGFIGRRLAAAVRRRVEAAVRESVADRAFEPLRRVEAARSAIATATMG